MCPAQTLTTLYNTNNYERQNSIFNDNSPTIFSGICSRLVISGLNFRTITPTTMKTPRIEEMVNGYTKEAMLFKVGEGEMERHQRLQNYVVEALTQAHQAGRDEAVEVIKPFVKRVRLDVDVIVCDCGEKYKDSDLDLSVGELEQALDDTIKALKDNK